MGTSEELQTAGKEPGLQVGIGYWIRHLSLHMVLKLPCRHTRGEDGIELVQI